MKKLRLEVHVMAEQEQFARIALSWDAAFIEQFDYQGGGVWYSVGTYLTTYQQDKDALKSLQRLTEDHLRRAGITEFYTEMEEFEGWTD